MQEVGVNCSGGQWPDDTTGAVGGGRSGRRAVAGVTKGRQKPAQTEQKQRREESDRQRRPDSDGGVHRRIDWAAAGGRSPAAGGSNECEKRRRREKGKGFTGLGNEALKQSKQIYFYFILLFVLFVPPLFLVFLIFG
uniref:Uncharacterized protein n=1 Tax=Opuntia streptacantha TaxID=393608 RepID=A0A7C9DCZ1_OPUST